MSSMASSRNSQKSNRRCHRAWKSSPDTTAPGLIQDIHRNVATRLARRGNHRQHRDRRLPVPLPFGADSDSDSAHRGGRILHPDVLPPCHFEHHVARRVGARDWRPRGRRDRHGRKRISAAFRAPIRTNPSRLPEPQRRTNSAGFSQAGWSRHFLFAGDHRGFVPARLSAGGAGRTDVSSAGVDKDAGCWLLLISGHHACTGADGSIHSRACYTRIAKSDFKNHPGHLFAGSASVLAVSQNNIAAQSAVSGRYVTARASHRKSIHAAALRRLRSLHADSLPGISIAQASQLLQEQDRIIRTFPEVETVFGSIGRSDSATDNAPLDMYDTTSCSSPALSGDPE